MLRLEYIDANGNTHSRSWHYSEPVPEEYFRARVLKITADGDELDLLSHAIRATIKPITVIDVTSQGPRCGGCGEILVDGFHVLEPNTCGRFGAKN